MSEHASAALPEHTDILIIGAGLSGIGAACKLRHEHPGKSITVLESRGNSGGTWDLFRYPGVRSDSDLYTYGYDFRPWTRPNPIAEGSTILDYIRDTARASGVDELIHYHRRVTADQHLADLDLTGRLAGGEHRGRHLRHAQVDGGHDTP